MGSDHRDLVLSTTCCASYCGATIMRPGTTSGFLDYAAERVFLRKVGGGYIFTHRLLMEYFASLEPTKQAGQAKAE